MGEIGEWIDIIRSEDECDINWDEDIEEEHLGLVFINRWIEIKFNQEDVGKKHR